MIKQWRDNYVMWMTENGIQHLSNAKSYLYLSFKSFFSWLKKFRMIQTSKTIVCIAVGIGSKFLRHDEYGWRKSWLYYNIIISIWMMMKLQITTYWRIQVALAKMIQAEDIQSDLSLSTLFFKTRSRHCSFLSHGRHLFSKWN